MKSLAIKAWVYASSYLASHKAQVVAFVAPVLVSQLGHFAPTVAIGGHAFKVHVTMSLASQAVLAVLSLVGVHKAVKNG